MDSNVHINEKLKKVYLPEKTDIDIYSMGVGTYCVLLFLEENKSKPYPVLLSTFIRGEKIIQTPSYVSEIFVCQSFWGSLLTVT